MVAVKSAMACDVDLSLACLVGSVIVRLYLTLVYIVSIFILPFVHYGFSSRPQHLDNSPSVSDFSFRVSTTILELTILEFIF
jgi:hypothetical protein